MKKDEIIDFEDVVEALSSQYPNRNIKLIKIGDNTFLYADGECKFCITGYCLLYNTQRLCKILENELL